MTPGSELLSLDRVTRTYDGPSPVTALRDVSLSIDSGDYAAIVGPSGSGKSTLLNILGLLDLPSSGAYVLDGHDTAAMSASRRAALRGSRIGFVFQAFHLAAHRSALENVALAGTYVGVPRKDRLARARESLDMVGLAHRADFLPTTLSGGERQRVAIARALAGRPRLLLCDEPTGNLDSARGQEIVGLFERMVGRGFTVLIVTHDDAVASRAERVFRVRDGLLAEERV